MKATATSPLGLGSPEFDHDVGLTTLSDKNHVLLESKTEFSDPAAEYSLVFDPGRPAPSEFERPIFRHFSQKPCHIWHLRSPINTAKLMKDFSSTLMRSEMGWNGKGPQQVYRLLFQVRPDLFLYIEAGELTVYAGSLEHIGKLRNSLLGYVVTEVEDSPKFMLIDLHAGGAYATPVQLNFAAHVTMEDLSIFYGHDFPEWERLWLERMHRRGTGLTILSGPTGTGKTTYLRSLVRRLTGMSTHCFYYIPTSFAAVLTSPEYVNFWVAQNQYQQHLRKVAILEDAEDLLLKRNEASANKVSTLLNVTDGFLADQLRLQVIATVNCPFEDLDPAIARPGRLVGFRHFLRLNRKEAQQVALKAGLTLTDQVDYSLAEIFCENSAQFTAIPRQGPGFAQ